MYVKNVAGYGLEIDQIFEWLFLDAGFHLSICILILSFQAGLNGHMYKMPEIPESFPELSDLK